MPKSKGDSDYVDKAKEDPSDYQITSTKKKRCAVDSDSPKPKRSKLKWSKNDDEQIKIGLSTYGNNFSKINSLFFSNSDKKHTEI
jgi:hypothetical protein